MDCTWALEGERRSGRHVQNAGEGQLGADDYLEKHIHCACHATEWSAVVLGPFASGNVSTRQNLLPGLAPLLHIFTEKQGTQWAIERPLLFTLSLQMRAKPQWHGQALPWIHSFGLLIQH